MPFPAPSEVPLALLLEVSTHLGGSLLVVTGAIAGTLRTLAVLTKVSPDRIEWVTALGFAFGVMMTILFVFIDQVWSVK
jgi:hypothetical protein